MVTHCQNDSVLRGVNVEASVMGVAIAQDEDVETQLLQSLA